MKLLLTLLASLLLNSLPTHAQRTPNLTGIAFEQKQGARMPSKSVFIDADGRDIGIGELFNHAPLVVVLGYFHCEKLCAVARLALLRAAQKAGLSAGADYLFVALKAYKTENNGTIGRANGVMAGIAKQFTNAELKALAGYVSSVEGELKTVPEKKFR